MRSHIAVITLFSVFASLHVLAENHEYEGFAPPTPVPAPPEAAYANVKALQRNTWGPTPLSSIFRPAVADAVDRRTVADIADRQLVFGERSVARLIGYVNIRASLLTKRTDEDVDLSKPTTIASLPRQMAKLSFALGEHDVELLYADETKDPRYESTHVLMAVLDQPQSYARFTVDQKTGDVIGTLRTPDATFLFLPDASNGGQRVYELTGDAAQLPASIAATINRRNILIWRHLMLNRLAELRPGFANIEGPGFASITESNLGPMGAFTTTEFKRVLQRLWLFTRVSGREMFAVRSVDPDSQGNTHAVFTQIFNGVPVANDNTVVVDRGGVIRALHLAVASKVTGPIKISETEAIKLAGEALEEQFRTALEIELFAPPTLKYYHVGDGAAAPRYHLRVQVSSSSLVETAVVQVDAATGEVKVVDAKRSHRGAEICADASGRVRPTPAFPPRACGLANEANGHSYRDIRFASRGSSGRNRVNVQAAAPQD